MAKLNITNEDENDKFTNLLEGFETLGQWWIPGETEKYSGTFIYSPQESVIKLKIIGDLASLPNSLTETKNIKLVNGITEGGQYITLCNCLCFFGTMNSSGLSTNRIIPQYVFIGCCLEDEDEMLFNEASYSCHNNEQFMGDTGFTTNLQLCEEQQTDLYSLSYSYPEIINFMVDDFSVSTNWHVTLPCNGPELHLHERASFTIKAREYFDHKKFLDTPIQSINSLLEIITGESLPIKNVVLKSDKIGWDKEDGGFYAQPISLLWNQRTTYPLPKKRHPFELVFSIRGIKDEIDTIFHKWHNTRLKYRSVHNLFFSVLRMQKELTIENAFLNLCQVLEAYHRIKSDEMYMEPEEYKRLLDLIADSVPSEHKSYLMQRLTYGNELSLRNRLKEIYCTLPEIIQNRIGEQKSFCNKIVNTRNYLTHYDESSKKSALSLEEMIKCVPTMTLICKVIFLLDAGFSAELLSQKFGNFTPPDVMKYEGD